MPFCEGIIPPEMEGKPIRMAAVKSLGVSSGLYKQAKFHGRMLLDGEEVLCNTLVHTGQRLKLEWPEKQAPVPQPSRRVLRVAYEDDHLLIVSKPAPLPTAPSVRQEGETLENLVFSHLGEPEGFVYRPVNRLDKGTSGLMAVAKDAYTQERLQKQLHTEDFLRVYYAVCEGVPEPEQGTVSAPIAKEDAASVRRMVAENGREAVTLYRVREKNHGRSLVELRLLTGRTHQIRVHMAYIGCPVCGDFLYGRELEELPGRFALHSHRIRLRVPQTGEIIEREDPLPKELQVLLKPLSETASQVIIK